MDNLKKRVKALSLYLSIVVLVTSLLILDITVIGFITQKTIDAHEAEICDLNKRIDVQDSLTLRLNSIIIDIDRRLTLSSLAMEVNSANLKQRKIVCKALNFKTIDYVNSIVEDRD